MSTLSNPVESGGNQLVSHIMPRRCESHTNFGVGLLFGALARVNAVVYRFSYPAESVWLRREATPVANLAQPFGAGMLEQSNHMAAVLEFVNIGPDFGLPRLFVSRGFATGRAAGVEHDSRFWSGGYILQLNKHAANFFDFVVWAEDVFVAQQVSKTELAGFYLSFLPSMKRSVFGAELLGRVARHPESILVCHFLP